MEDPDGMALVKPVCVGFEAEGSTEAVDPVLPELNVASLVLDPGASLDAVEPVI